MNLQDYRNTTIGLVRNLSNWTLDRIRYGSCAPSVTHQIWVDPRAIIGKSRLSKRMKWRKLRHVGTIIDGDWDLDPLPLSEVTRLEMLRRFYDQNCSDVAFGALRDHYLRKGLTEAEIKQKRYRSESIYYSIKSQGFKGEVERSRVRSLIPRKVYGFVPGGVSGVRLSIGRDGQLLWVGSHHRLAASLSLGLEAIPAQVLWTHREWQIKRQTVCERVKCGGTVGNCDHPDLTALTRRISY